MAQSFPLTALTGASKAILVVRTHEQHLSAVMIASRPLCNVAAESNSDQARQADRAVLDEAA